MNVTFLGTGTSHGIPVIGCDCAVCRSPNPRNRRRRCALYLVAGETHLLFDIPPDFRDQALSFGVKRVDALFITHAHADHIFGFDDLRSFSALQNAEIPVYAAAETIDVLRCCFGYVEKESYSFGSVPRARFVSAEDPVRVGPLLVTPLPVLHADLPTRGYRIDGNGRSIAYIPDAKEIPPETLERLKGLDLVILDGLRPEPHPTHLSIPEAVEILRRLGARRSFLTHLTHDSDHETLQRALGDDILVPWDGLEVTL